MATKTDKKETKVAKTDRPSNWIEKFFEAPWSDWHPGMEVAETDKDRTWTVDVGNMTDKDLNVTLKDNMLTIRGFLEEKTEDRQMSKSFQRSFTLPEDVNLKKIKIRYNAGKLLVHVQKNEPPREIPIETIPIQSG
mmetsp:Transcript_31871/g.77669  ORF Transcript_31871/g.77669 Transcript_31871/m.77669 type:complete len:136 (-) Transcript_31871:26-433(-)